MAALDKFPMVQRKWLFGRAQFGQPAICNFCEVRIGRRTKLLDDFRKRIAEIFVVAFAETVALHYDMTAKRFFFRKERGESGALLQIQEWTRRRIPGFGQLRSDLVPLDLAYAVLDWWIHSTARVSRLGADHLSELLREIVPGQRAPKPVNRAWRRTRASGVSSRASRGRPWGPSHRVNGEYSSARECRRNDTWGRNFPTGRCPWSGECRRSRVARKPTDRKDSGCSRRGC